MSETCNNQCESCNEECEDRKKSLYETPHPLSKINKVIGVVSGKGGVGKSLVTSMLAVTMNRKGYHVGILDADITGPSIPKAFGIKGKAVGNEYGLFTVRTKTDIELMSINLLLDEDTDPVVWRGPKIAGTVKQFYTDVIWGGVDYLFIDLPPGTGDVPLTVFQSIPLDGIIVVTSPQELVGMIVEKAVKMAGMLKVPILGLVENMSYFKAPDTGITYNIFGDSHIETIAKNYDLKVLAKVPIDPDVAKACDEGNIESIAGQWFDKLGKELDDNKEEVSMKIAVASEHDKVTEHFGHCVNFNVFDVNDGKIIDSQSIPNPGHKPGFLPNFLNDMGVGVIVSGGMGGGAIDIFNEKGIEVIVGASGDAKENVEAYLAGKLKSTGSVCHEHQHAGDC